MKPPTDPDDAMNLRPRYPSALDVAVSPRLAAFIDRHQVALVFGALLLGVAVLSVILGHLPSEGVPFRGF